MTDEKHFAVGEIAIIQPSALVDIGEEVEIVEGLQLRTWTCITDGTQQTAPAYRVRKPNGDVWTCTPRHLRRKRPPRNFAHEIAQSLLKAPRIPEEEASHVQ